MFCNNCGTQNPDNATFCSNCGNNLAIGNQSLNTALPPLQTENRMPVTNDDIYYSAFVGEKYHSYFRSKWFGGKQVSLNEKKIKLYSFSLAGFFLGLIWLCYRKMYGYAIFLTVLLSGVDVARMHSQGMKAYMSTGGFLTSLLWVLFTGFMGNYFYGVYCAKKIKNIIHNTPDEQLRKMQLSAKGGTSIGGAIGFTLLNLIIMGAMYGLFAPRWLFM